MRSVGGGEMFEEQSRRVEALGAVGDGRQGSAQ